MTDVKRIKKLDENVINKIAAGEIIQRPANATKELLENSLDANSTQIIISIKQGGLGVIQIQDNGSGICKDDFPILCEKFTTSKLQEFHDLLTISTFGFRGEALASITHVAHVHITSKTKDSPCAYKAEFSDSKLLIAAKPCAGNTGTIIRVEDLFYNIPVRKSALKTVREEYSKIVEVVSNYAILNADKCSITLKRIDDNANPNPDVRIVAGTSMEDCVVELFGNELSKQLIYVDFKDDKLDFSLSGRISKPNYNSKKFRFILFINKRLVHCAMLKKSVESIYSNLLPKHSFPFIFLHLQLPSKNLDVNVHPTKYEVHFLHQELIIASIQSYIEKILSSSSESRSFPTQSLLNKSLVMCSNVNSPRTSMRPSEIIRVDPRMQKLSSFFSSSSQNIHKSSSLLKKRNYSNESLKTENVSIISIGKTKEPIVFPKIIKSETPEKQKSSSSSSPIVKIKSASKNIREFHLVSLDNLRKSIESTDICNWRNFVYVGMIDHDRVLIQREKHLLLLNIPIVNYNLFYQLCLQRFGNFGKIDLIDKDAAENESKRTLLKDLFVFGVRQTDKLYDGVNPDEMVNILADHADMLLDYFSIKIDVNAMTLLTIPLILDKFIPDLRKLPKFIVNLCTKINWSDEELCIHGICREISEFYAYGIGSSSSLFANEAEFESVFENTILPMYKTFLRIPHSFEHDGTLVKLTSLPDLYSVFERC